MAKVLKYAEDETLVEDKQQDLKKACLEMWEVPTRTRRGPSFESPESVCRNFLNNDLSTYSYESAGLISKPAKSLKIISNFLSSVVRADAKSASKN